MDFSLVNWVKYLTPARCRYSMAESRKRRRRLFPVEVLEARRVLATMSVSTIDDGVVDEEDFDGEWFRISRSDSSGWYAQVVVAFSGDALGDLHSIYKITASDAQPISLGSTPNADGEYVTYISWDYEASDIDLLVRANNDIDPEAAKQLNIRLVSSFSVPVSGISESYEGAGATATITINESDNWEVNVTPQESVASEYGAGEPNRDAVIRFTRSGETDLTHSLAVKVEIEPDEQGNPYSFVGVDGASSSLTWDAKDKLYRGVIYIRSGSTFGDFRIIPTNDPHHKLDSELRITILASDTSTRSGLPYYTIGAGATADVTIEDNDDWTVDIAAIDAIAAEFGTSETPLNNGLLRITRSNETDLTHSLSVAFKIDESTQASLSDYHLVSRYKIPAYLDVEEQWYEFNIPIYYDNEGKFNYATATIPGQESYVDIFVRPRNDSEHEDPEEVVLKLLPSEGNSQYGYLPYYAIGADTATVSIHDLGGDLDLQIGETSEDLLSDIEENAKGGRISVSGMGDRRQISKLVLRGNQSESAPVGNFTLSFSNQNIAIWLDELGTQEVKTGVTQFADDSEITIYVEGLIASADNQIALVWNEEGYSAVVDTLLVDAYPDVTISQPESIVPSEIPDGFVVEGDVARFYLEIEYPLAHNVTFWVSTGDAGNAQVDEDYVQFEQYVTIVAGQTRAEVFVRTLADVDPTSQDLIDIDESTEYFAVEASFDDTVIAIQNATIDDDYTVVPYQYAPGEFYLLMRSGSGSSSFFTMALFGDGGDAIHSEKFKDAENLPDNGSIVYFDDWTPGISFFYAGGGIFYNPTYDAGDRYGEIVIHNGGEYYFSDLAALATVNEINSKGDFDDYMVKLKTRYTVDQTMRDFRTALLTKNTPEHRELFRLLDEYYFKEGFQDVVSAENNPPQAWESLTYANDTIGYANGLIARAFEQLPQGTLDELSFTLQSVELVDGSELLGQIVTVSIESEHLIIYRPRPGGGFDAAVFASGAATIDIKDVEWKHSDLVEITNLDINIPTLVESLSNVSSALDAINGSRQLWNGFASSNPVDGLEAIEGALQIGGIFTEIGVGEMFSVYQAGLEASREKLSEIQDALVVSNVEKLIAYAAGANDSPPAGINIGDISLWANLGGSSAVPFSTAWIMANSDYFNEELDVSNP